jgi:hypothetical protein
MPSTTTLRDICNRVGLSYRFLQDVVDLYARAGVDENAALAKMAKMSAQDLYVESERLEHEPAGHRKAEHVSGV